MSNRVIARAVSVAGQAYAHNDMGELRTLAVGDELSDGETVVTPDGSCVDLEMLDGSTLSVRELSGQKLCHEMTGTRPAQERCTPAAKAVPSSLAPGGLRISNVVDGAAVQTVEGHNLFFNESPLYWEVDNSGRKGRAVVHAGSGGAVSDQTAFELTLTADGCGEVLVNTGVYLIETHNIPFTTGDPRPGLPIVFFGIPEEAEASAGAGPGVLAADLNGIGYSNNWYREGRDIVFEFLGKAPAQALAPESPTSAAGTRAINSFSFRNSGANPASFVARAYRGNNPEPVYEAGSEASPICISAGGIFTVFSELNYDRLVLSHPNSYEGSGLKLSLEGYCEFAQATSINMALPAAGRIAGERITGDLRFTLEGFPGQLGARFFPAHAGSVSGSAVFDSVWEELG